MRTFSLVALLLLSGCATTRFVTVACLTPAEFQKLKDAKPGKIHDQLNGQSDHDIRPIAGRLVRVEAWGDGLIEVLGGCASKSSA